MLELPASEVVFALRVGGDELADYVEALAEIGLSDEDIVAVLLADPTRRAAVLGLHEAFRDDAASVVAEAEELLRRD